MEGATTTTDQPHPGWRLRVGVIVFVVGFLSPLLIPVVAASGLPAGWKVVISTLLSVGIPEVFSFVAITIMGKSGFAYLKGRIFGLFKKHGPPDRVSRTRYRIGLVMFVLPLVFGWLGPYVSHLIPGYEANRVVFGVAGDLMFVASLFVLGGDFWDKLRALFVHGAKAQLPHQESSS